MVRHASVKGPMMSNDTLAERIAFVAKATRNCNGRAQGTRTGDATIAGGNPKVNTWALTT
jgi:hypothetical protein